MPLESATYISGLNSSNPAATDALAQADDHIRLIKAALLATFPNINGAMTATEEQLNALSGLATDGVAIIDDDGAFFASDTNTGIVRPGADQVALRTGGTNRLSVTDTTITAGASVAYAGGTGQLVPSGTILDYAGTTEPTGYLFCYGQAVSRSTYSTLFTLLGTTFGVGDGSSTFNLPDLRGRVVAGQDDMGGSSANRLTGVSGGVDGDTFGAAGGLETHTLTEAQLAAHDHGGATGSDGEKTIPYSLQIWFSAASGGQNYLLSGGTLTTSDDHTHSIPSAGSGTAHNNVQPTLILNKIIKT